MSCLNLSEQPSARWVHSSLVTHVLGFVDTVAAEGICHSAETAEHSSKVSLANRRPWTRAMPYRYFHTTTTLCIQGSNYRSAAQSLCAAASLRKRLQTAWFLAGRSLWFRRVTSQILSEGLVDPIGSYRQLAAKPSPRTEAPGPWVPSALLSQARARTAFVEDDGRWGKITDWYGLWIRIKVDSCGYSVGLQIQSPKCSLILM